ncbi:hypothetical protein AB1K62_04600 [Parasphingorhabdus sp. JC815]|uniref:hypothetical protein n=1 Tax=Parasphingorhabdus sp. JC815 TaxID=3232140 RepID=UPI0034588AFA
MAYNRQAHTPVWFWIGAVFALIWNSFGLAAYASEVTMSAGDFARLTAVEQNLFANRPFWASAAFAVAAITGFLGAVMLLLRRPITVRLFLLSLISVLVQFSSFFILDGYTEYFDLAGWFMQLLILVLAIIFFIFAHWAEKSRIIE